MTNYIERVIKSRSDVMAFGKFKNRTIEHILINEPSYILWLQFGDIVTFPEDIVVDALNRETQRLGATIRKSDYLRQDV